MKEISAFEKVKTITFDGYNIACFTDAISEDMVLEIINAKDLDAAIISSPSSKHGFLLHFVTNKTVNVKRLVSLLVEEGKKNDLFWEYSGKYPQTMKSARVYSANLNFVT